MFHCCRVEYEVNTIEDMAQPFRYRHIAYGNIQARLARMRGMQLKETILIVVERADLRDAQLQKLPYKLAADAAGGPGDSDASPLKEGGTPMRMPVTCRHSFVSRAGSAALLPLHTDIAKNVCLQHSRVPLS
jgi:hypothetical protein